MILKYLRILAYIMIISSGILSILNLPAFGILTPSPLRDGLLFIGLILVFLVFLARRQGSK